MRRSLWARPLGPFWCLGGHRLHRRPIAAPVVGASSGRRLSRRVDKDQHAAVESPDLDEAEVGYGFDALEEVLALADRDGGEVEVEFVDQPERHQGGVEWAVAVF